MQNPQRNYSFIDHLCLQVDLAVRSVTGNAPASGRPYPVKDIPLSVLTREQNRHAAGLMRINHAGEVSAQALYHGQSQTARSKETRAHLEHAAQEEGDHLAWCKKRLEELNSQPSALNGVWYSGSYLIGLLAGLLGDQWSLGFIAETEEQVIQHLQGHMQELAETDQRSHALLQHMQEDEARHRDDARTFGAHTLPLFIKKLMSLTSRIMVKTAYWI